jgi:hypothetical protein
MKNLADYIDFEGSVLSLVVGHLLLTGEALVPSQWGIVEGFIILRVLHGYCVLTASLANLTTCSWRHPRSFSRLHLE